jgi:hypothetical protein
MQQPMSHESSPGTDRPAPAGGNGNGEKPSATPATFNPPLPATVAGHELLAPPQGPEEIGRLGPYPVRRILGQGGMGIVFEAEDPQLRRPVALKVLQPALAVNPAARERFLREARAAAALNDDHVVVIHQVGEDRGVPFLAMELLQGEPLDARMRREGPLSLAEVLRIGEEAARGVAAAHAAGLVHRDVKPANLWLETPPHPQPLSPEAGARGATDPPSPLRGEGSGVRGGRVKVLDFGLARAAGDDGLTQEGTILGTPAYMAPEQVVGKVRDVGPAADVYALGAVLFELLTGRPPFQAKTPWHAVAETISAEPPAPSRLRPEVPPDLEAICLKCLHKDPARRYPDAAALADDLARYRRGEPVQAAGPGSAVRARRDPALAARGIRLAALQQALRAVEPAALLVAPRVLDRVIRQAEALPSWLWRVPHRDSYVVDRHILFRHVEQDELDLGAEQRLPPTVLLLARPSLEELDGLSQDALLRTYWRRLFHASVHLTLNGPGPGTLSPEAVRERVEQIGAAEFEEIRQVLDQDSYLLRPGDDREVYCEFAALYLELRAFAPELLACTFPGLGDREAIDRLLARDLDAGALLAWTRLAGAPDPGAPLDAPAAESNDEYWKLVREAERAAEAGNCVKAAILRTRAARVAPAALAPGTRTEAEVDLQRLALRLRQALQLSETETRDWLRDLPGLLDKADQGRRPAEAALLYDLQNTCLDQERDLYALGLVESLLSAGRRPVKRPLPSQRLVRTVRHLRAAAGRLPRTRLAEDDRAHLAGLLARALRCAEERLRERFGPVLRDALQDVGLAPDNPPERVAFDKVVDELLDRIASYGFLTFGDLRDAISRNQLKLPDLASPGQLLHGDELRRLDRRLTILLDGVYRPGEFYVRWLEGLAALNFGTPAGRLLTTHVTLPFGGAFVLVEALSVALHHLADVRTAWPAQLAAFLVVGLFFFGLIHVAGVRRFCARVGRGAYRLGRELFVELPARVWRIAAVRRLLTSWPAQLGYFYVLKPLIVWGLVAWWWPPALTAIGGVSIFLAANFVLNSRLGAVAGEFVTRAVLGLYDLLRGGLLPGLYRLVVRAFKQVLDTGEYLLFRVDEWLRYRSGDGQVSLVLRTALGVVWFPVSYVIRFYMVVLIEPVLNPLKLPVCSVAAKFTQPFFWVFYFSLTAQLTLAVGVYAAPVLAFVVATATLGVAPNAFGFLFWEMKENWRLYRANRRPNLGAVPVGGHGETVVQLLRPGFHSGTLPRLFARLRKAERRARVGGPGQAAESCRHQLAEIEEEVRLFVTREMVALLAQARCWQALPLTAQCVTLSPNRIGVELVRGDLPDRPVWLEFEERARWLVGTVRAPGWLGELTPEQRDVFATALAGLYKLAGVQLVREQLRENLPAAAGFDLTAEGLVVWQDRRGGRALRYDLRQPHRQLEPRGPDGVRVKDGPVLDADRLLFSRWLLPWTQWVESWRQDEAGEGHPRRVAVSGLLGTAPGGCRQGSSAPPEGP